MRRTLVFAAVAFVLVPAAPSSATDEFCSRVRVFEQAPLAKLSDGGLQRRWMDFIWERPAAPKSDEAHTGSVEIQIGYSLRCIGSDDIAKKFCAYAAHHTSYEFPYVLPLRILQCHGFVSPSNIHRKKWAEELSWDSPEDLIEQLQIDLLERNNTDPSIRLTIMPFPESPSAKKPPFFKALSAKLGIDGEE